jgi:signal transduction histidine kinase
MQVSGAGGPRTFDSGLTSLLAGLPLLLWAASVLLFVALPEGSAWRTLATLGAYWSLAVFALAVVSYAAWRLGGWERAFWALVCGGLVARFAGYLAWGGSEAFGISLPGLALQYVFYPLSYLLLLAALLLLVDRTTRRITPVIALDAASVMLSVGMLVGYFVLDPVSAAGTRAILVALFRPVCDAGLLFLSLVVLATARKPPFAGAIADGFLAFLVADAVYVWGHSFEPYELGQWPELLWALGILLLGLAALRAASAQAHLRSEDRLPGIEPRNTFAFWFGPLSPPLHYGLVLAWGALHPPLPAYVLLGGVLLMLYFALRISLVSYVTRRVRVEREQMARRLEQSRISRALHDDLKQKVHGISLMLGAAREADRNGDEATARDLLDGALEASREASYQVSRPIGELQASCREGGLDPTLLLRQMLGDLERYFGLKTHEDLRVSLGVLEPDELSGAYRIISEALWNAARHARARNVWLHSDRVGSVVVVRVRDDGQGFAPEESPPGLGLSLMRARAQEIGAKLDLVSAPGHGTTVQLRFEKKG